MVQGSKTPYSPMLWLVGSLMFYLNYCLIFPAFAVKDHRLLTTMYNTWQVPMARKRGTLTASRAPDIIPENPLSQSLSGVLHRARAGVRACCERQESADRWGTSSQPSDRMDLAGPTKRELLRGDSKLVLARPLLGPAAV